MVILMRLWKVSCGGAEAKQSNDCKGFEAAPRERDIVARL